MALHITKLYNSYNYKKSFVYMKSTGVCMILVSGCWLLYQVKKTSFLINSVLSTKILDLDSSQVQYIYMDNPRYKDIFMFGVHDNLDYSINNKPNQVSNRISKWWKSLNRTLVSHLLNVAQSGNTFERKKAVNTLSNLKYLKDWHYFQVAQILDARTAVSLARLENADLRFFLKPPFFNIEYSLPELIEKLYGLLRKLNTSCKGCHPCLEKFLSTSFKEATTFEYDVSSGNIMVPHIRIWDEAFLQTCIHAVHHHSSLEEHSKDVVNAGGLQILMDVYKFAPNNTEICILLAKILSNLSLFHEYLEEIFMSGWIRILTQWSKDKDIRLAGPASRALANLDTDDHNYEKYPQRIYPLYPLHRVENKQKLDVIFIHGLLGGVFVTWRQRDSKTTDTKPSYSNVLTSPLNVSTLVDDSPPEFLKDLRHDLDLLEWERIAHDFEFVCEDCPVNLTDDSNGPFFFNGSDRSIKQLITDSKSKSQCWPKDWLPQDVPYLRIIGVNYDTNLSMWTPLCPIEGVRSTIEERSTEFRRKLATAGVGKRPIIWVCHSMGGLLVKKMLIDEWKSGDQNKLLRNTRGVVFYSTPHQGSHVANLKQTTQMLLWPSVEVQELREQSPHLLQLHNEFLEMLKEYNIDILSFGESKSTLVTALKVPLKFVNSSSANPKVGEFFEIPQDHLQICKPANRHSFLYQKVLNMIRKHINGRRFENDNWKNYEDPI